MEPDGGEVRAACEQQASCRAHGSAGLSQLPWRKTPGPEVCLPRFSPAVPPANHTRPQSHLMRPKHVSSPCKTQHGCGSHPNAPQHLGEAADRSHHLEHTVQPRCVTQWEPALSSVQGKEVTHLKQLKAANPCLASPQGQVSSCPHCSTPPATCLQPLALSFPCIQAACTSIPAPTPSPAQHPAAWRARRALQAWRWAASNAQAITCAEIPLPRAVCSGEAVAVFSCTASPRRAAEFGHFLTTIVLIHFFSAESGCVQFNAAGRKGKGTPGAEATPVTQQPRRKKKRRKKRGKTQPQPTQREAFLIF